MSNTKYCSECGRVINRKAVFCPHCGCQVEEINTGRKDRDIIINNNNNIQGVKRKKHSLFIDLIMLFFTGGLWIIHMARRD